MEEHGVAQGVRPQRKVHRCRPLSPGMQQLLACILREIVNAALGNTILKMGVDATKGKLLARVAARLFECVVGEAPIVAVIVLGPNAVLGSEGLKSAFCGNGFNQRVINLRVEVLQATEVINEDGSAAIALLGEFAFELRNKP